MVIKNLMVINGVLQPVVKYIITNNRYYDINTNASYLLLDNSISNAQINCIGIITNKKWSFINPIEGFSVYCLEDKSTYKYTAGSWSKTVIQVEIDPIQQKPKDNTTRLNIIESIYPERFTKIETSVSTLSSSIASLSSDLGNQEVYIQNIPSMFSNAKLESDLIFSNINNSISTLNNEKDSIKSSINSLYTDFNNLKNQAIIADNNGLVPSNRLPSYVDDVMEFNTYDKLPSIGESGKIYIITDTNTQYRWSGSDYIKITSGEVSSVNGYKGVVYLTKNDIGLNNIDNTSDANKSVYAATKLSKPVSIFGQSFDGSVDINGDIKTDKILSSNSLTLGSNEGRFSFLGTSSTGGYTVIIDTTSGTITANNLSGNSSTATKLQTSKNINGVPFDGSSDITIKSIGANKPTPAATTKADLPNNGEGLSVAAVFSDTGSVGYPIVYGNVLNIGASSSGNGVDNIGVSQIATSYMDNTSVYHRSIRNLTNSTWNDWAKFAFVTDNVASATKLQTPRKINGAAFDGSADITIPNLAISSSSFKATGSGSWTTSKFISWLNSQGAFDTVGLWSCKMLQHLTNNANISDSNVGWIHLSEAVVEVFGDLSSYTIRVSTGSVNIYGSLQTTVFTYYYAGTKYPARWVRTLTNEGGTITGDLVLTNSLTTSGTINLNTTSSSSSITGINNITPLDSTNSYLGSNTIPFNTTFTKSLSLGVGSTATIDTSGNSVTSASASIGSTYRSTTDGSFYIRKSLNNTNKWCKTLSTDITTDGITFNLNNVVVKAKSFYTVSDTSLVTNGGSTIVSFTGGMDKYDIVVSHYVSDTNKVTLKLYNPGEDVTLSGITANIKVIQ